MGRSMQEIQSAAKVETHLELRLQKKELHRCLQPEGVKEQRNRKKGGINTETKKRNGNRKKIRRRKKN